MQKINAGINGYLNQKLRALCELDSTDSDQESDGEEQKISRRRAQIEARYDLDAIEDEDAGLNQFAPQSNLFPELSIYKPLEN